MANLFLDMNAEASDVSLLILFASTQGGVAVALVAVALELVAAAATVEQSEAVVEIIGVLGKAEPDDGHLKTRSDVGLAPDPDKTYAMRAFFVRFIISRMDARDNRMRQFWTVLTVL